MKILFINEYFTENIKTGANIIAFNSYYQSLQGNNECYFYANNETPFLEEQEINKLFPISHINKKGILNKIIYRYNSIYNFSAQKNLEKILLKVKPDIVHIHAIMELSFSVILVLKKYNIPYVITVHDAGFVCPVMGTRMQQCTLCSINISNCLKNKCSRNNIFCSIYVALKFLIWKHLINLYPPKKLITPSLALKRYIEKTKYANNVEIKCIHNSLDKAFLKVFPHYQNKKYFLFVGNLLDVKGVNILLSAVTQLPKEIKFHIAGDGLQKDKYLKFIQKNNLTNVFLVGKKNREELINEYQNCIAVIVPSNWFENFPTISMESFINGKPVIASNIGGIPEQVEHNKTGLLFEPANVEQLKECILKYWNKPKLVIEHGKNAYQKAITQYTEERYYKELIKLYKEII